MRINDQSKTDFDRAKIKLTGHFDRRPTGRYFEPWLTWRNCCHAYLKFVEHQGWEIVERLNDA